MIIVMPRISVCWGRGLFEALRYYIVKKILIQVFKFKNAYKIWRYYKFKNFKKQFYGNFSLAEHIIITPKILREIEKD